jgi:aspartate-semialdehyde dehydrogenase
VAKKYHIAIVGATGAVGVELLRVLERRAFRVASVRLLASARSAGKSLVFAGKEIVVEPLSESAFAGIDIAFFSAGSAVSREFAPIARRAGAIVIDN